LRIKQIICENRLFVTKKPQKVTTQKSARVPAVSLPSSKPNCYEQQMDSLHAPRNPAVTGAEHLKESCSESVQTIVGNPHREISAADYPCHHPEMVRESQHAERITFCGGALPVRNHLLFL